MARVPGALADEGGAGTPASKEEGPGTRSRSPALSLLRPQSAPQVRRSPRCPRPAAASPVPGDQGGGR